MRYLGLDIGDRWIGVALSDPQGMLASPLAVIARKNDPQAIDDIKGLIKKHDVALIVAGLPRLMNGTLGQQAVKVQNFVASLTGHIGVPIEFRDERLTTAMAKRLKRDTKFRKNRKIRSDSAAAALILQGYLDEQSERLRADRVDADTF